MTGERKEEFPDDGYISDGLKAEIGRRGFSKRFPQKGIPMDESAERGLMRLRGELIDGEPAELVITEKYFERFPVLRPPGSRGKIYWWEPRYDRITGEVYTTKMDSNPAVRFTDEGKKAIPDAEEYAILKKPPWRKNVDLNKIPKSWRVSRVVPQSVWDGVTGALRQMDEIRRDYKVGTGVEYGRVEELFIAARRLFQAYTLGEISTENVQGFAGEIFGLLQAENVPSARHPNFEELEEIFAKALQPDRLQRFNPQAARMRIYKILRNLTMREVHTALIARKTDRVFRRLYIEWENQRYSFVAAKVSMEEFAEHPIFRSKPKISDEEITDARTGVKEIKNVLSAARTAPFLLPASLTEAMLMSKKLMGKRKLTLLRRKLEIGGVEDELNNDSVEDLLMQRRPADALNRLRHPHSVVVSALEDPDNYEITVFE